MQTTKFQVESQVAAPQVQVRTGLCSGGSIETCVKNVQYWQQDFKNWYNQAKKNGFTPPFPSPI